MVSITTMADKPARKDGVAYAVRALFLLFDCTSAVDDVVIGSAAVVDEDGGDERLGLADEMLVAVTAVEDGLLLLLLLLACAAAVDEAAVDTAVDTVCAVDDGVLDVA